MTSGHKDNHKDPLKKVKKRYSKLNVWQRWLVWALIILIVMGSAIAAGRAYTTSSERAQQNRVGETVADEGLFRQAEKLFQDGNYKQAAEQFGTYAETASGQDRFHGMERSAQAYARAEMFAEAAAVYKVALEESKGEVSDLVYVSMLGSAARAAEQADDLELARDYNNERIRLLEKEVDRAEGDSRNDLNKLLLTAREYAEVLDSLVKLKENEAATAEAEAEEEARRETGPGPRPTSPPE